MIDDTFEVKHLWDADGPGKQGVDQYFVYLTLLEGTFTEEIRLH